LKFVQLGVLGYLRRLSRKTKTDIDDTLVDIVGSLRPPFYSFLAFYGATLFIDLSPAVKGAVNAILVIWIAYQVVIALQILIDYIVRKKFFTDEKGVESKGMISFVSGLLKGALWAVAALTVLSNLGVNVNSLIAGLGIGGLAVAFALQNILADLFSSFAIFMDKPFAVGDFIVVGEHKGTVERIGIKTTRIRSLSGEEVIISNRELTSVRVQNFKRLKERRVSFSVGATYDTPLEKVKRIPGIMKEIVEAQENARFDRAHFASLGDSALVFEVVYYVLSSNYADYMDIQQEINVSLMERFANEGIEFAYPTQTIHLVKG